MKGIQSIEYVVSDANVTYIHELISIAEKLF